MTGQSVSHATDAIPVGAKVSRYQLCYKIAHGGMGAVYLARMQGPGRFAKLLALKVIHPHLASEPDVVEMFLEEARLQSRIGHPNVCTVTDFGTYQDNYFMTMEYLQGETLEVIAAKVAADPTLSAGELWPAIVLRVIIDACEGLHAAHELRGEDDDLLGLVHRDVSAANTFVTFAGATKIMDFGVAALTQDPSGESESGTKGRYQYLAPERAKSHPYDRRADIWALGVMLWELLALRPLFARSNPAQTLMAICDDEPDPITQVRPGLPPDLDVLLDRALAKDPEERFATAREMGRALHRVAARMPTLVAAPDLADFLMEMFEKNVATQRRLVEAARKLNEGEFLARPDEEDSIKGAATVIRFTDSGGFESPDPDDFADEATEVHSEEIRFRSPHASEGERSGKRSLRALDAESERPPTDAVARESSPDPWPSTDEHELQPSTDEFELEEAEPETLEIELPPETASAGASYRQAVTPPQDTFSEQAELLLGEPPPEPTLPEEPETDEPSLSDEATRTPLATAVEAAPAADEPSVGGLSFGIIAVGIVFALAAATAGVFFTLQLIEPETSPAIPEDTATPRNTATAPPAETLSAVPGSETSEEASTERATSAGGGETTEDTLSAEARTAEGSTAEGSTAEGSTAEARTAEARTAEARTAEARTAEGSTAEARTAEGSTAEARTAEGSTAEPEPTVAATRRRPDRATRTRAAPGTVAVVTPGGWAEIYLGGRHLGRSPGSFSLPAGNHVLVLRPFGDRPPIRRRVRVRSNALTRLPVLLPR